MQCITTVSNVMTVNSLRVLNLLGDSMRHKCNFIN